MMMRLIVVVFAGSLAGTEAAWPADSTKIPSPAAKAITATGEKPYDRHGERPYGSPPALASAPISETADSSADLADNDADTDATTPDDQ